MQTTQEIAAFLGVTPQSVNRYIRKACDAEGLKVSTFGKPDPSDRRIRTFSETEVELILKYAPEPKRDVLVEPITAEVIEPAGQIVRSASRSLIGFEGVQSITINVQIASTEELDAQTEDLRTFTGQGFGAIAQMLTSELKAEVAEVRSQNRNAVRGAQAVAVSAVVQELGKPDAGQSQP
ncbi:MAG: MarR family winged helix-turn-helix transcriptional regulator [Cyanobacteriota bacterium]